MGFVNDFYGEINIHNCNGQLLRSCDLDEYGIKSKDDVELLWHHEWISEWQPTADASYIDYIEIYQTPLGFIVYEYICGGYSEYTFEPTTNASAYETESFDIFWNLGLTDSQREMVGSKLDHLRTEAGGLIYGR